MGTVERSEATQQVIEAMMRDQTIRLMHILRHRKYTQLRQRYQGQQEVGSLEEMSVIERQPGHQQGVLRKTFMANRDEPSVYEAGSQERHHRSHHVSAKAAKKIAQEDGNDLEKDFVILRSVARRGRGRGPPGAARCVRWERRLAGFPHGARSPAKSTGEEPEGGQSMSRRRGSERDIRNRRATYYICPH